MQYAVDAVAHEQPAALRLDVDVAGALAHAFLDNCVEQPHHRRILDQRLQQFDGDLVLGDVRTLRGVPGDRLGGRFHLVVVVDRGHQFVLGGDDRLDLLPGHQAHVVHGDHVQRVDHGQGEAAALPVDRHHAQPQGQGVGDELDRVRVDLGVAQADVAVTPLLAHRLGQLYLGDDLHVEEHLAHALPGAALDFQGLGELFSGDGAHLLQRRAQRLGLAAGEFGAALGLGLGLGLGGFGFGDLGRPVRPSAPVR